MNICISIFILTTIIFVIMLFLLVVSKKVYSNNEKNCPFECGFDPLSNPRMHFMLKFYFLAVLFLVFDVELVLLMPMIKTMMISLPFQWLSSIIVLIIVLIIGIYYEWFQGCLNWSF